jgi:hypothetical protein
MLSEQEIQGLLHAGRVLPLAALNPHGPLGLEHLAAEVARQLAAAPSPPSEPAVSRAIALPAPVWETLERLASAATPQPLSATRMAAAILEQALEGVP